MSFELLEKNIVAERNLVYNLVRFNNGLKKLRGSAKREIEKQITLTLAQIKMVNSAIPGLIDDIHFFKPIAEKPLSNSLVNIKSKENSEIDVVIKKEHEDKFIKNFKNINSDKLLLKDTDKNLMSGGGFFIKLANRLFKNTADKLSRNDLFINIKPDLRKIGSTMIVSSYIAVMLLTTLLMFILGLFVSIVLIVFNINYLVSIGVILFLPLITFFVFYLYPSSTVKSLEKSINQELPFLTIFMSAIATSGIEPSKIFSILLSSQDYPAASREIKKLINYINFYGYDLVSALKTVAKSCPSERLGLLFDGIATSITSGGELSNFLNKHAETLLFDYRLEREKYTHLAETFMNIYISVVIAAPMILMVLLILMSLTGFGGAGLSPIVLTVIVVFGISLLNLGFLLFLNTKQPKF